jgi:hypothetical protein
VKIKHKITAVVRETSAITLNLNLMVFLLNPFYIYIYFMEHKKSSTEKQKLVFHCTGHSLSPFFGQCSDQPVSCLGLKHAYMETAPVMGFLPVTCSLALAN